MDVRQLGTVDYLAAWQLQRDLADTRLAGGTDTLLLLEHPLGVHRGPGARCRTSARARRRKACP
ncbi:hypothetical protein MYXE_21270 [Mycobacterium xenopi]|uniref:Uncharacterized protein n=1 Tax=Mycobacterium xenopi TaxID=1789 RepID=A0AAD1H0Y9_MYCXE|nr:hypothetical protein MYXE_21270 [Mycobacterium xenopi]